VIQIVLDSIRFGTAIVDDVWSTSNRTIVFKRRRLYCVLFDQIGRPVFRNSAVLKV
jgi:hypothetical protein